MNNNDILRRLRFAFNWNDDSVIDLFRLGDKVVTRTEISNWLKKDEDEAFESIIDKNLAALLNGFIIHKRGRREGAEVVNEKTLINNLVLKKLKIALSLTDEDIVEILDLAKFKVSKHEINAFFRAPTQSQYRLCKDQILRNFLMGLQIKYTNVRPTAEKDKPTNIFDKYK